MTEEEKTIFIKFIEHHNIGTLVTVDQEGNPHGATIDFVVDENLNLLFNTALISKKYRNLEKNPNVCVVFSDNSNITLQYQGKVKELEGHLAKHYQEIYDNSTVRKLWKIDVFKLFRIEPTYVRYSNYLNYPPKIKEIEFKI